MNLRVCSRVARLRTAVSGSLLIFAVLFVLLVCVFPAAADETATLNGRVVDPKGLVVAGAKVEAVNVETGVHYPGSSNADGYYNIVGLPAGKYHVLIEKGGFKSVDKTDVVLHIQEVVALNVNLEIGSMSEVVTVQAGGIHINMQDGTVSTLVDATMVANMPLNGRSFQDLILLTPGVVGTPPIQAPVGSEQEIGFSVNGQRPDANYFTVDGVSANVASTTGALETYGPVSSGSQGGLTALGTTQALVSVDDMQEFRVQTSSYSAQYGRNPGGQIGIQTKSGTNTFHGDVYDYLRNNALGQANDWFYNYDNLSHTTGYHATPPLRQNDFGGAVGGPIEIPGLYHGQDKTFFFVNYEGLRFTSSPQGPQINAVPDLCLRGLATTADPCPAGVTPAFVPNSSSPAGAQSLQAILRAYPYPNFQAESPIAVDLGLGEDVVVPTVHGIINNYSVRLDQVVSEKMTVFARVSNTTSSDTSTTGETLSGVTSLTRTYTFGVNNIFSSKLSNEFRFNYSSSSTAGGGSLAASPYANAASIACTSTSVLSTCGVGGTNTPIPTSSFAGYFGLPPSFFPQFSAVTPNVSGISLPLTYSFDKQTQWNPVDTVNYTVGAHQFKFGVDYRRIPGTVDLGSSAAFAISLSNLETGVITPQVSGGSTISVIANAPFYPLYTNFSAFAQDTWKTTRRLTLSLGLRWDVNPAPSVWQGHMPYTITGTGPSTYALLCANGVSESSSSSTNPCYSGPELWSTTWFNFSPRLGVAYQLRTNPGWQTVLRGGGGVFYDTGQQEGSLPFRGPGYTSTPTPNRYLNTCTFPGFGVAGCTQGATIPAPQYPILPTSTATLYGVDPHLQLPYTLQWNFSVEQGLGRAQSLSISYVGSHGSRLLMEQEVGLLTGTMNSNGDEFFLGQNGLTSDYDALQVHFQRQFSKGLTFMASYVWSHCIDYASINFEIGYQRGNCDYDIRQNFSSSFSYTVPNVRGNAIVKALLDNWGVDDYLVARTGFPLFLQGNEFLNPSLGTYEYSPVYEVTGQPEWLYGNNCISTLEGLGELTGSVGSSLCPGGRALNPCAFASETVSSTTGAIAYDAINAKCPGAVSAGHGIYTYSVSDIVGQVPRNGLRGYDLLQMNLAIRREFPIYERLKLQFRAEAFNVFNHPNFGQFALTTGSTQFGLVTQTLATASGATVGGGGANALYQAGGPRIMQFALKLIF